MDYFKAIDEIMKDDTKMAYRKSLGDISERSVMFMWGGILSTFGIGATCPPREVTKDDLEAKDWEVVSLYE